jgi:membrane-bound lytic murein transglycosylase D
LKQLFPVFSLLSIVIYVAVSSIDVVMYAKKNDENRLSQAMDRENEVFLKIRETVAKDDECVPVRVGGSGKIDIQYLACSDAARRQDAESFKVSENIRVPQAIARRVNFWRRVYSLWSKNQYVIHVPEYPEVVLEIHDSSRISDLGDKSRERVMKSGLDTRRRQYRQILSKLAGNKRIDEKLLSPTELRVYKAFEHINDKNKFHIASANLRVQRGQREYIAQGLEVAQKYLPHVEDEFKKQGLMPELARIAFIESSFNLQALSKVGASGVYQVMPETGRDYLIVNGEIDERNDPIKASRAAAKLLAMNYKILGEWPLAITAYNHGVGGISRAMREKGTSDIVTLINKYDGANFGFASKNFYAGFLGLLATLKNAQKVFPEIPPSEPLKFEVVRVGGLSLVEVKQKYKINNFTITSLNPDVSRSFIRAGGTFPPRYALKIPPRANNNSVKLASWRP